MRRLPLLVLCILFGREVLAQDNSPKYSNEFLQIGVGGRSLGLGLSAVAISDDANSGYWNPAGLLRQKADNQLSLMHSAYFGGIANYDFGAFATKPDTTSALAISVLRFSVDDIADTRFLFDGTGAVNYDNIRYFSASDYAFLVSYAKKIKSIQFGTTVKVIHRVVGDFASSWGFGLDVGLQRQKGKWQTGLVVRDVFGTFNSWTYHAEEVASIYSQTGNEIPVSGLELTLPRAVFGVARMFDLGEKFHMLATSDLNITFDGKRNTPIRTNLISADPYGGFEFDFKKVAFVRFGVSQFQQIRDYDRSKSWSFQPSMGVGFQIRELTFDYAFTDIGNQAAGLYSHIFSLKVDFSKNEK